MDDFDRDSAGREAEEAEVDPMLFENGSEGGEADGVAGRAGDEEEEEGEDLLRDDFLDDYRPMPHLDEYEREHLADSEGDTRSSGQRAADRRAAEREMARRDAGRRGAAGDDGGNRLPSILRDQGEAAEGLGVGVFPPCPTTRPALFSPFAYAPAPASFSRYPAPSLLPLLPTTMTVASSLAGGSAGDAPTLLMLPWGRLLSRHSSPPPFPPLPCFVTHQKPSVSPLFLSRRSPLSPRDCAPGYDLPLPSPFLQGSFATEGTGGGEEEEGEEEDDINDDSLYNMQGSLREWVSRDEVRRFMARRFRHFLQTFKDSRGRHRGDSDADYAIRIRELVEMNSCSLELDYSHLLTTHPILAVWLADAPKQVLEVLDEVAQAEVFRAFPMYEQVHERIYVRVAGLPVIDQIRDIRQTHLNCLIRVGGVVTRRTGVFPQLQQVKYNCIKCGAILGPFFQTSSSEIRIRTCAECQSKGPFQVNVEQTIYRNYQKMTLQESPGSVPAGRLPRYKEVVLLNDLIDCARPGEEIEVTGIYVNNFDAALNTRQGFPVFSTVIEANHISKRQDVFAAYRLTDEDKEEIMRLSRDPRIAERIIKSIAPSIYGHENVKTSLALAMFGGQEKNAGGKHRLRGDINALLLGDPGTAKSQFLKYLEKTANRAVYTTGKGASAVGLTAAVHKDPVTREWTLEGGALVLADRGTCLIDEFDKMSEQDRVSIHEAMEQQSISISKAGIVTSLAARCSVIAAANPIGGRYDSSKTFGQNVELSEPILSRFDCLLVIKDLVDPVVDEHLARFVVGSHQKSHPQAHGHGSDGQAREEDPDIIPQDILRKYVTYARQNVFPRMHDADADKIALVYADLRRQSLQGQGVPIAVRHVESMIRMSEAHARMHLRQFVTDDDVDTAIRVLLESFIGTQKYGVQRALEKSFSRCMSHRRDLHQLMLHLLRQQQLPLYPSHPPLRFSLSPLPYLLLPTPIFQSLHVAPPGPAPAAAAPAEAAAEGGAEAAGPGAQGMGVVEMRVDELEAKPSRRRGGAAGEGEEVVEMRVDELEAKAREYGIVDLSSSLPAVTSQTTISPSIRCTPPPCSTPSPPFPQAREYGIVDLSSFFASRHFTDNHFTLDTLHRVVLHPVV
ncbi:unnamed protein product [Closterium sp. Naga37s-1]|nr:unnamed protein product [Closterium sp. Naga37s-1]